MNRVDKVKLLIDERFNGNQADFARAVKKAPAQVNQWLNGYRNIGDAVTLHIETALGLPVGWIDGSDATIPKAPESNAKILGGVSVWDSNTPLDEDEVEVPFYKDIHLAAGDGFSDDIEDYNSFKLRFSKSTLRRNGIDYGHVVCVSADGDSMMPIFPDGATLGIDVSSTHIRDGQIYAINHGGLLRTKILKKRPDNRVLIQSYNTTDYPDEEVSMDDIRIIGRVFWWSVMIP